MSYRKNVKAVKLRSDRIIVVCETKIFIYNLKDMKFIGQIDTFPNPMGLCSVNTEGNKTVIAGPDKDQGYVFIHFQDESTKRQILAHKSIINCLQLNSKGTLLATASNKGTVIRIFNTDKGERLQELRRGNEYAQIWNCVFDHNDRFIAISSDSGTIHVFCLKPQQPTQE